MVDITHHILILTKQICFKNEPYWFAPILVGLDIKTSLFLFFSGELLIFKSEVSSLHFKKSCLFLIIGMLALNYFKY